TRSARFRALIGDRPRKLTREQGHVKRAGRGDAPPAKAERAGGKGPQRPTLPSISRAPAQRRAEGPGASDLRILPSPTLLLHSRNGVRGLGRYPRPRTTTRGRG